MSVSLSHDMSHTGSAKKKEPLNFCVYLSNHLTKLPEILTANTLIHQKCCVKKSAWSAVLITRTINRPQNMWKWQFFHKFSLKINNQWAKFHEISNIHSLIDQKYCVKNSARSDVSAHYAIWLKYQIVKRWRITMTFENGTAISQVWTIDHRSP